jgi:hypothetical protein
VVGVNDYSLVVCYAWAPAAAADYRRELARLETFRSEKGWIVYTSSKKIEYFYL